MLQHEVRILEEERGRLMREVTLKTELEGGYAKRGAKQSMAIKEAQGKIASLDQSMQQVCPLPLCGERGAAEIAGWTGDVSLWGVPHITHYSPPTHTLSPCS